MPDTDSFLFKLLAKVDHSSEISKQVNMAPTKKNKVDEEEKNEEVPAEEKKEDGRKNNGAHLRVPDHLKKPRKEPTGNPRGRRPGQKNKKTKNTEIWLRNLKK